MNNAGVMALPERTLNEAGWEMQFATNHLAHFALAVGLHDGISVNAVHRGAATSLFVATSPVLDGVGGRYFEDCHDADVSVAVDGRAGVAPYALDPGNADRLWELSLAAVA